MKFKATAAGLMEGLRPAIEVATRNAVKDFEFVDRVGISVKEDELNIFAWNGRMSIRSTLSDVTLDNLNMEAMEDGKVVVDAKSLSKVLVCFKETDELVVKLSEKKKGKELIFELASDSKQYVTARCYDEELVLPEPAKSYTKQLQIRRNLFLRGVAKVRFAIGFEQHREMYLYWVLRADPGKARFMAGTGQRFAIMDFEGKDIFKTPPSEGLVLRMPREQTDVFTKVLAGSPDDYVSIRESRGKEGFHARIQTDVHDMILLGINPDLKYIDEDAVLTAKYDNQFIVELSDWAYVGKSTIATYDEQLKKERKPHRAVAEVDFENKEIIVQTNERMRSSRKAPIIDSRGPGDSIRFTAAASYISEIAENADEDGYIQISHIGNKGSSGPKSKRPIFVQYYAADKVSDKKLARINDSIGATETYCIFFAQLQG